MVIKLLLLLDSIYHKYDGKQINDLFFFVSRFYKNIRQSRSLCTHKEYRICRSLRKISFATSSLP